MLSGKGALDFALRKGFRKENLLTDKAKKRWNEWLITSKYEPIINIENHDTIDCANGKVIFRSTLRVWHGNYR